MRAPETIRISVNGEPAEVPAGLDVLSLLQQLGIDQQRVAIELNRSIIRKPDWPETQVPDGASLEIVQFVGGG